ncbi:hypothetical protein FJ970_13280 [Mesorhizobium sp. B2-1-8]|uniref:hypothetical protein n=1 Tax=Mesorhizobium sp. B2-1-8 TaxID=2589967 RepID=UPI0015E2CD64|nr:hypothetical protein [Mesorhizobium sp. B2-1-8]UCI21862.1 hypothetical protein FJ970_13280 [Mesorhizobium sp. B2-1-8]
MSLRLADTLLRGSYPVTKRQIDTNATVFVQHRVCTFEGEFRSVKSLPSPGQFQGQKKFHYCCFRGYGPFKWETVAGHFGSGCLRAPAFAAARTHDARQDGLGWARLVSKVPGRTGVSFRPVEAVDIVSTGGMMTMRTCCSGHNGFPKRTNVPARKQTSKRMAKMLAMISPSCIAFPPNHAPAIGNEHQRTTFNV